MSLHTFACKPVTEVFPAFEKLVTQILPFRIDNRKFLDPIWNKHHIERVEIVLKETLDVKGD